jgi:hypothetical protein
MITYLVRPVQLTLSPPISHYHRQLFAGPVSVLLILWAASSQGLVHSTQLGIGDSTLFIRSFTVTHEPLANHLGYQCIFALRPEDDIYVAVMGYFSAAGTACTSVLNLHVSRLADTISHTSHVNALG